MANTNFFAFSGMEGTGKTTIVNRLTENFKNSISIREPDNYFREFLCTDQHNPDPFTETLAFLTSKSQNYNKIIYPALSEDKMVFADRWIAETYAYQCVAKNGMDTQLFEHLYQILINKRVLPLITFILIASPETSIKRSMDKLLITFDNETRFEKLGIEFHTKVLNGFKEYTRTDSSSLIIDTENITIDETYDKIFEIINSVKINLVKI
jgi:dTMP kinase